MIDEVEAHMHYTIQMDATPFPEQRCQQLNMVVKYFSKVYKQVVVECLHFFHMGYVASDGLLVWVKEVIQDLLQKNMLCP